MTTEKQLTVIDLTEKEMHGLVRTYLRDRGRKVKDYDDFVQDVWVFILTSKKKDHCFDDRNHLKNWVKCMIDWHFRTVARNFMQGKQLKTTEITEALENTKPAPDKDTLWDIEYYVEKHLTPRHKTLFQLSLQGATLHEMGEVIGASAQRAHVNLEEMHSKLQRAFGKEQRLV